MNNNNNNKKYPVPKILHKYHYMKSIELEISNPQAVIMEYMIYRC